HTQDRPRSAPGGIGARHVLAGHRDSFVEYDDLEYVNNNPQVQSGLNADNVRWALTTTRMGNWHPLTWLSLMADATCWGTNPFGFHLTNVLLHAANVVLLYLALLGMTGMP